ncbi:MAG TPA: PEP-CTERM-box response regulator transcription factor [Candidatus Eisenbacteria bacterium]|nr:PEP-CTERM-box response regulator transcription factor [Candidatus Eisenbacteria bacterium]
MTNSERTNATVTRTLLIVDDEPEVVALMRRAFDTNYEVITASQEQEAVLACERHRPQVVILDLTLDAASRPELAGLRVLDRILQLDPNTRVIIVTGNGDDANALSAMRRGAFDYYFKPIRLEELKTITQRAFHIYDLYRRAHDELVRPQAGFDGIVGASKSLREIIGFVRRVAPSDISVLICGESGTGKELIAHAIHRHSPRRNNPFVAVNCGAIPENLLESELFGHERGSFTGAYTQKKGKFEAAHTGTLFLDEIGELAPPLQVKLLRFLQDRKIERVGSTHPIDLDVRIVAATNRDLKRDMENHVFREDLYYRLKVVPLVIPPLRERAEDIVPLARHFLQKYCREHHKPRAVLTAEAERALVSYAWPGNVRELENLISRAVVLSTNGVVGRSDLGLSSAPPAGNVNLKLAKKAIEEDFVKKALMRHHGVISRAARDLGISRVNLYELMHRYGIQIQDFKGRSPHTKQQVA